MRYRPPRRADQELVAIYLESAERFGAAQAESHVAGLRDAFDLLAGFSRAACERVEVGRSIRAYPYEAHPIVYRIEGEDILIVRLPYGRLNWITEAG